MADFPRAQFSFAAGELGGRVMGRADRPWFREGLRTAENVLPLRQGPALGRWGTGFVSEQWDETARCQLLPFQFNVSQAYVLEFSAAGRLRFLADQGVVLDTREFVNGAFATDLAGWTDADAGTGASTWVAGAMQLAGGGAGNEAIRYQSFANIGVAPYTVTLDVATATVTYKVGTSIGGTQLGTGTLAVGVGRSFSFTPTTNGTVYVQFQCAATCQVDNVALSNPEYVIAHPYTAAELEELQIAQQEDVLFFAHPAHKPQKLTRAGHDNWSFANYTPVADPFTATDAYPAAVTLFGERIVWGGTNNQPSTIFASKAGDIENMTTGANDADGFVATLAGPQNNTIRWLLGGDNFIVGTSGAEWSLDRNQAFTPSQRAIRARNDSGVAPGRPAYVGRRAVYVRRFGNPANPGRTLGSLRFSFEDDTLVPQDLTARHPDILAAGVHEMAWQQEPERLLWLNDAAGALVSLTLDDENEVVAWARHPLGQTKAVAGVAGASAVESLVVIAGADRDEVWLAVKRTIDGVVRRYIEILDPLLHGMDSGLFGASGSPTATWAGLDHMEGETLAVRADGAPLAPLTVTGGIITTPAAVSAIEVGLAFVPTLEPMDAVDGAPDGPQGTALGRNKSQWKISLLLQDTVGVAVDGKEVVFRQVGDEVNTPIPAFTGIKEATASGWNTHGRFTVTQPVPAPFCLLAYVQRMEVNR